MRRTIGWFLSACMVIVAAVGGVTGAFAAQEDVWSGVDSIEDVEAIYHFTLDGVEYALPCQISDFTDNGWEARGDLEQELIPGLTCMGCWFEKEINGESKTVTLSLLNGGGDACKAGECRVTGISVSGSQPSDDSMFETANGVHLGDSLADAYAIYGQGTEEQDLSKGYVRYRFVDAYEEPANYLSLFSFAFDSDELRLSDYSSDDTDSITSIEMSYYKSMPTDTQEVSSRPAYLDAYEAPEALGDRVEDMVFEIDGDLYQMPVPASAFTANGWSVEEKTVPGLRSGYGQVEQDPDDYSAPYLSCTFQNDSEKMVNLEDTYLKSVTFYSSTLEDGMFTMASGLTLGSTREQVLAAVPALSQVQQDQPVEQDGFTYKLSGQCYYIESEDGSREISIYIDEDADVVSWITLEAEYASAG